eukprot:1236642-Rhodomonas_salina.1
MYTRCPSPWHRSRARTREGWRVRTRKPVEEHGERDDQHQRRDPDPRPRRKTLRRCTREHATLRQHRVPGWLTVRCGVLVRRLCAAVEGFAQSNEAGCACFTHLVFPDALPDLRGRLLGHFPQRQPVRVVVCHLAPLGHAVAVSAIWRETK